MSGRARIRARGIAALLVLAGCSGEPAHGPGEVRWDRDLCERCSMAIGDRRFAAQVRDARDHRLHRFDDVGCALLWLAEGEEPDAATAPHPEIWVRDAAGRSWIDGYAAVFADGFQTPMGYGFGVVETAGPSSMDLAGVRQRLLAREDERRRAGR